MPRKVKEEHIERQKGYYHVPTALQEPEKIVKLRQAQILAMYSEGMTVPMIASSLQMSRSHVQRDLNLALEEWSQHWGQQTPEHAFVTYAAYQMAILRKLQYVYDEFCSAPTTTGKEGSRHFGAVVSALKAQSDIFDKILTKGQEIGIVQHKREGVRAAMTGNELLAAIKDELQQLEALTYEIDIEASLRSKRKRRKVNKRRRKALEKSKRLQEPEVRYTVKVKRVVRNRFGVVRVVPDWKYRAAEQGARGNMIPVSELTDEQIRRLAAPQARDPEKDDLEQELKREREQREAEADKSTPTLEDAVLDSEGNEVAPLQKQNEEGEWLVRPRR